MHSQSSTTQPPTPHEHCHCDAPPPNKNKYKEQPSTKHHHPVVDDPIDPDPRFAESQWSAFEDIICSPTYYAFIAQDDLPIDVLELAVKARKVYLAQAGRQIPKEELLSVIWDSGASVCVSFDRNDFVGPIQTVPAASRLRGFF